MLMIIGHLAFPIEAMFFGNDSDGNPKVQQHGECLSCLI
jgi:hypothetical protein